MKNLISKQEIHSMRCFTNGPFIFKCFIFISGAAPLSGGHHVFTVAQTGQTKHCFRVFITTESTTGSLLCLESEGEVRGVQLQHGTSPLDVTKAYTLNL